MASPHTGAESGCGRMASMRSSNCVARSISRSNFSDMGLRAVVGVDAHVLVAEIAGPHGVARVAAAEVDAHRDLGLLHHALAVFFTIGRVAPARRRDVHVIEPQADSRLVEIVDARVT